MTREDVHTSFHFRRRALSAGLCMVAAGSFLLQASEAASTDASKPVAESKATPGADQVPTLPDVDDLLRETDTVKKPAAEISPADKSEPNNPFAEPSTSVVDPKDPTSNLKEESTQVKNAAASTKGTKALSGIAQVKQLYKDSKYQDCLNVLATIKPTDETHYYTGLCLQAQGQLQRAAAEYNYTITYAKSLAFKQAGQKALQQVTAQGKTRGETWAFAKPKSGDWCVDALNAQNAKNEAAAAKKPKFDPHWQDEWKAKMAKQNEDDWRKIQEFRRNSPPKSDPIRPTGWYPGKRY